MCSGRYPQLTNRFNTLVVEEIKAFRQEMETILGKASTSNDINSFWLRNTHKPELTVLLVETDDPDQESKLYLGTNMEVSISQMRTLENEYRPGRSASRIATTKRLSQIRQHRKRH
jgi:hypothetical protein